MFSSKYRYICLDLDGTLLDSNKRISTDNQKAINDVHQNGIGFIVATGRHLEETFHFLKEYNLTECFDYIVYADGCGIYDIVRDKNLGVSLLTNKDVSTIVKVTDFKNLIFYNENNDYYVFDKLSWGNIYSVLRNNILTKTKVRYLYYPFFKLFHNNIEKQKVVIPSISLSKKCELKNNGLYVMETNSITEVLPINKCLAVKRLLEILNVSCEEVLYFGDEFNDKESFECFDSVVMGNAPAELLRYSIIHAKTNDENGVGIALREIMESNFENMHE